MKIRNKLSENKRTRGSVTVEYMALTVFVGLALISGATMLGNGINQGFNNIVSSLSGKSDPDKLFRAYDPALDTDLSYYRDDSDIEYPLTADENGFYYTVDDGEGGSTQNYINSSEYFVSRDGFGLKFAIKHSE